MPQTTRITVNQNQNGQYQTTIPKALGDALNLDGQHIEWNALRKQVVGRVALSL